MREHVDVKLRFLGYWMKVHEFQTFLNQHVRGSPAATELKRSVLTALEHLNLDWRKIVRSLAYAKHCPKVFVSYL